jgi:hypothetical protein
MLSFYDAYILYATVVKRLYHSGKNYTDGLTVSQAMWNTTVRTPLRTNIDIHSDGDRILLYDFRCFDMELGSHSVGFNTHEKKIVMKAAFFNCGLADFANFSCQLGISTYGLYSWKVEMAISTAMAISGRQTTIRRAKVRLFRTGVQNR